MTTLNKNEVVLIEQNTFWYNISGQFQKIFKFKKKISNSKVTCEQ